MRKTREPVQLRLIGSLEALEVVKGELIRLYGDNLFWSLPKQNTKGDPGWRLYVTIHPIVNKEAAGDE